MIPKPRKLILQIIFWILVIYFILLAYLFIFQRNLMYHPQENNYSGDKIEVEIEKVQIQTADNISLLGWFHKKDLKKFKTVVYFHGNAGSLENRIHKLNHFKNMNVNFLIIAWRGFSANLGKPSENALYGTGIATEVSQNKKYAGLILETPFTSMIAAAKNFYPYIPVSLILKDKYKNDEKIKNINIPVLVMHGEKDQIVPFSMGKKMFDLANDPKSSYFTKHDDHMMEFDNNMVFQLSSFIKSLN